MARKISSGWTAWIPLLALVLCFPKLETTLRLDLLRFTSRLVRGEREPGLREAGLPRAGERVLPPQAHTLIQALRQEKARDFTLAPEVKLPSELHQRLVEGAYPILLREESCFRIQPLRTPARGGCRRTETIQEVALDRCC